MNVDIISLEEKETFLKLTGWHVIESVNLHLYYDHIWFHGTYFLTFPRESIYYGRTRYTINEAYEIEISNIGARHRYYSKG